MTRALPANFPLAIFLLPLLLAGTAASAEPAAAAPAAEQKPLSPAELDLLTGARQGLSFLVRRALKAGAGVDARDTNPGYAGETALIKAAYHENIPLLRFLIDSGAEVHARDEEGETALLHAAANGNLAAVRLLLEAGAETDIRSKRGVTPLLAAIDRSRDRVVDALLKAGADPNLGTPHGYSPLMFAAQGGQHFTQTEQGLRILRALLRGGARVDHRDVQGKTALMKAAYAHRDIYVRELIAAGADVNATDTHGRDMLYRVLRGGHTYFRPMRILRLLLNAGARLDRRYPGGQSLLHQACFMNRRYYRQDKFAAARILIERKPDLLQSRDAAGRSVLNCYPANSTIEYQRRFRRFFAERGAREYQDESPAQLKALKDDKIDPRMRAALLENRDEIFLKLIGEKSRGSLSRLMYMVRADEKKLLPRTAIALLRHALSAGDRERIEFALSLLSGRRRERMLAETRSTAVRHCNTVALRLVLKQNGFARPEPWGFEQLLDRLPARYRKTDPRCLEELIGILTKAGENINKLSTNGVAPLHRALRNSYPDQVRALIEHGADPNLPDGSLRTPLSIAASMKEIGNVRILLKNGATLNATGPGGTSALMVAVLHKQKANAEILRSRGARDEAVGLWHALLADDPAAVERAFAAGARVGRDMLLVAYGNRPSWHDPSAKIDSPVAEHYWQRMETSFNTAGFAVDIHLLEAAAWRGRHDFLRRHIPRFRGEHALVAHFSRPQFSAGLETLILMHAHPDARWREPFFWQPGLPWTAYQTTRDESTRGLLEFGGASGRLWPELDYLP